MLKKSGSPFFNITIDHQQINNLKDETKANKMLKYGFF